MKRRPDLFVTGAPRSGTTLLSQLLSKHPLINVVSQPLPKLLAYAVRQFHQTRSTSQTPISKFAAYFPMNDMFAANSFDIEQLNQFLSKYRLRPNAVQTVISEMLANPGEVYRPTAQALENMPSVAATLAECIAKYLQAIKPDNGATIIGSKEIHAEALIPYFLEQGSKVILILRDPRDVVASAMTGRGPEYAGHGMPLLFVLRGWRKSVAIALEYENHPHLLLLKFEDLVTQSTHALDRVADFLGVGAFVHIKEATPMARSDGTSIQANSSHFISSKISPLAVGQHSSKLKMGIVRGIEMLCEPEMQVLGYPADRTQPSKWGLIWQDMTDPCQDVRPKLVPYALDTSNSVLEQRRLQLLRNQLFDPGLHLFQNAFKRLVLPRASLNNV